VYAIGRGLPPVDPPDEQKARQHSPESAQGKRGVASGNGSKTPADSEREAESVLSQTYLVLVHRTLKTVIEVLYSLKYEPAAEPLHISVK